MVDRWPQATAWLAKGRRLRRSPSAMEWTLDYLAAMENDAWSAIKDPWGYAETVYLDQRAHEGARDAERASKERREDGREDPAWRVG